MRIEQHRHHRRRHLSRARRHRRLHRLLHHRRQHQRSRPLQRKRRDCLSGCNENRRRQLKCDSFAIVLSTSSSSLLSIRSIDRYIVMLITIVAPSALIRCHDVFV